MHQIAAVSGQEVGGLTVILPPLYEIFWSTFVLPTVLLPAGRYVLPCIHKTMDKCAAKIEEGFGAAEQAKANQAAVAFKYEGIIHEAHAEARIIRERASDEAKVIVAAVRHEATSEANRILKASECWILAEKQAAQISLRSEVGLLVSELTEKIVGERLTGTVLTSRAVDRFPDEFEADSARVEERR